MRGGTCASVVGAARGVPLCPLGLSLDWKPEMSKVFAEEVRDEAVTDARAFVPFGTVFDTTAGECNGATATATLNVEAG